MTNFEFLQSKLSEFAVANLGRVQALVISKVNAEINRILLELLNTCPPPDVLEKIGNVVNTVRPVITKAEGTLQEARKIADVLNPAIDAATIVLQFLTYNPQPIVIGTIAVEGVPTIIYAPSQGKVNRNATKLGWFASFIGMLRNEGKAIAQAVQATEGVFDPIVNALDQIDALLQACLTNQDLSDEERKKIVDNIQNKLAPLLNTEGIKYASVKSGREYTIKIITDPTSPPIAPRRQAIVQDFRGITVLTGPGSFASDPQILIEEIKFRIENQLP